MVTMRGQVTTFRNESEMRLVVASPYCAYFIENAFHIATIIWTGAVRIAGIGGASLSYLFSITIYTHSILKQ